MEKKSTTVRSDPRAPRLLRLGLGALEAVAPPLAARLAEELFLIPRRSASRAAERKALRTAARLSVPFGGKRLAAWRWGQGPTVLLVHGWAGRGSQLHAFVEPLVKRGLSVVAFDAPGHGESSGMQASLPELALAVRHVADAIGPIHALITHSMGGAAAGLAIADGLAVDRAVMIAPPADAGDYFRRFADALGISDEVAAEARRRIEERLLVPFSKLSAERIGPRLEVPLLVFHDRGDRNVPWLDGAITADAVPHSELVTTEGLGHHRILLDPAVVGRTVDFVSQGVDDRRCAAGCGRLRGEDDDLCPTCDLDRELFDRDERWTPAA